MHQSANDVRSKFEVLADELRADGLSVIVKASESPKGLVIGMFVLFEGSAALTVALEDRMKEWAIAQSIQLRSFAMNDLSATTRTRSDDRVVAFCALDPFPAPATLH